MRKLIFIVLIIAFALPVTTLASIYGTIRGKVTDTDGSPVIGASVRLEGTRLGAIVKPDGSFTILNINSGTYVMKVTAVGFLPYEVKVEVQADIIREVNVKLSTKEVKTKEVEVIGRKLVENTAIGRNTMLDNKDLTSVAREGVQAIVGLSAGVFNSGNGFNVRGSRETETSVRVDGIDQGNQFTGGISAAGLTYSPIISAFATEEVQVKTGNFSVEYGEALGGVVNTIMKSGRNDKYEGFLRWRTDVDALWGSQQYKLKLLREGNRYVPVNDGPGYKSQGPGLNKFEFGAGGPIPFLDKSTFYLTSTYQHEKYLGNSYEIYDPDGNNLGQMPNNSIQVKVISPRLKFQFIENIDFLLGGQFGMTNWENSAWGWLYATTPGAIEGLPSYGVPERLAKQVVANVLSLNGFIRVTHRFPQSNSFYEFTISNQTNNDEFSKRKTFDSPSYFTGYDIWYPQDEWAVDVGALKRGSDKIIDQYTPITNIQLSKDGYLKADFPVINPLTGYYEGGGTSSGSNNAYGMQSTFVSHGNDRTFSFRKGNFWQIDGSYEQSIEGTVDHMFKAGFEFKYFTLLKHSNSLPWDSNPFFDVYTDEWGGNLYADNKKVFDKTSKAYNPIKASAYVLDQIKYKGIIISPGLRIDYFNPNSDYRLPSVNFVSITADTGFAKAPAKVQLSPRVYVAYPITDASNITIAYGLYFQMPELQYMYDAFAAAQLRGNSVLGDPNMEAQRSNQYSIEYNNSITQDFSLSVSAYYKDIYNQVGMKYVPATPVPFYLYSVSEYGNARGIEVSFERRPIDHFGFRLNYNLSSATGTSSGPGDNYLNPNDPYTNKQAFPLSDFPVGWDRRHRINGILNFFWGPNEGPSIGGIYLLENTNINLSGFFQTGTPYTRLDAAGNAIGEYNAERQPSRWSTDLRFSRSFKLRDWFGDGAGNTQIEFYFDITNLLNNTSVAGYFARTGDPDDDGVNFYKPATDFSATPYYKDPNFGKAESVSSEQYDLFGNRLYNAKSDFDGNGVITQEEKFMAFSKYLEDVRKFRGNYAAPREVYFGLMFRF